MTTDKEARRTTQDSVLTEFGHKRLRELAKQRSKPAGKKQVAAYYGGWLAAISQLGFGLGFLLTAVLGAGLIVFGGVDILQWAIRVVFYLFAALASGRLAHIAFEASGVDHER